MTQHIWDYNLSPEAVAMDISDLRLAARLTPNEFCARVGVTRTALWNWENGKSRPKSPVLLAALRELAAEFLE